MAKHEYFCPECNGIGWWHADTELPWDTYEVQCPRCDATGVLEFDEEQFDDLLKPVENTE